MMMHSQTCIPRLWAFRAALIAAVLLLAALTGMAGTWTSLRDAAPGKVQLMLLLTDGTVMAANSGTGTTISNAWYKLTPDKNGSYVNGKWTTLNSMADTRLYYSSCVLRDGRVFVAGGEYGTGGAKAEIYDPQTGSWTALAVPTSLIDPTQPSPYSATNKQAFLDSGCMLLPDGRVMIAPVLPNRAGGTVIYDPIVNTWTNGPANGPLNQDEASWVKLPDDSILTVDASTTSSERYLPRSNTWTNDAPVPVSLYGSVGGEIGPAFLLPDGTAYFLGASGSSAIYTPTGNSTNGSWAPGPTLPNVIQYPLDNNGNEITNSAFSTLGTPPDAAGAMMVNGRILYALSGQLYNDPRVGTTPNGASNNYWSSVAKNPQYPAPTTFFVYDPVAQVFAPIPGPTGATDDVPAYKTMMLDLPDGTVLYAHQGTDLYDYALDPVNFPEDRPLAAGRPTISAVSRNNDGTWHLTGTKLNGISQGAAYGDDAQMDSNYPLVRLTAASGEVTYARTFNWSSTGVQTGNKIVSTEFAFPAVVNGTGAISIEVVANGIASDPVPLPIVGPGEIVTFSGNSSMGANGYEILGGNTTLQDDGSASGILLRGDGGTIQLLDSATADTATIGIDGGMGNGGRPGLLLFHGNSTAAGAEIVNHAGVLGPNFKNLYPSSVDGFGGTTIFYDTAKAGTAQITCEGEAFGNASVAGTGGVADFRASSSADHGTFIALGATAVYGNGGIIEFEGGATADHGTFANHNSNSGTPYSQGRTVFFENATAALGVFTNIGGDGGFVSAGGTTEFRGNSTAANGTFINQGGTGGTYPGQGATQFFENATAASGVFLNKPAPGGGGGTEFYGHSTAANGTFTNDSNVAASGDGGGEILFKDDSTAGLAHFRTTGLAGGYVTFRDRSSADHGTFLADPNLYNTRIVFRDTSTAGDGTFEIGGSAYLQFFESATAGNAAILLRGNGSSASLGSFLGGSAGNATITVMGSEQDGTVGGSLGFQGPATAGNATITLNGTSVKTYGASGGMARLDYDALAGTATFIANGGTDGGAGARIEFARGATAEQARFILNTGSALDVSGNIYSGGTTAGSIEGAGNISLGGSALTVGALDTSTTISGVISDGSNPPYYYAGGSLAKVGTGTLTLSGTNTYTGLTTINAGALALNGSLAGGVQVNGGATLKGSGSIGGTVTVAPGGLVGPGNSPGTLTIWGDYSQGPEGLLEIEVAGPNPESRDLLIVKGNVNLGGTLLLVFSGYAPSATDTFPVLEVGGSFNANNFKIVVLGLKPGYQPSYQVSGGKLILTATSSGQLRNSDDPIQVLKSSFAPQSGFVFPVFTVAGATYQYDTSTDLKNWTRISEVPGANVLVEFRNIPSAADAYRFYRVVQIYGTP